MKELNLPYKYSYDEVKTFIGRGAKRLFELALKRSFSDDEFNLFLKNYEKCQYISEPYKGVLSTLKELEDKGIKLIIYSNKPDAILQKLCKSKLFSINFVKIQGKDKSFLPKPDVTLLKEILLKNDLLDKQGLFVGDSVVDVETAKNINLKCAILTYGYGIKEDFIKEKPDYYLNSFEDVKKIIWTKKKN